MIIHVLIAIVAGWLQRYQQQVITYLLAENRVLKAQFGGRRLRLPDTETAPPRGAGPSTRPQAPEGHGDPCHARHPPTVVQATDRPHV
jgi:hypothetical protein